MSWAQRIEPPLRTFCITFLPKKKTSLECTFIAKATHPPQLPSSCLSRWRQKKCINLLHAQPQLPRHIPTRKQEEICRGIWWFRAVASRMPIKKIEPSRTKMRNFAKLSLFICSLGNSMGRCQAFFLHHHCVYGIMKLREKTAPVTNSLRWQTPFFIFAIFAFFMDMLTAYAEKLHREQTDRFVIFFVNKCNICMKTTDGKSWNFIQCSISKYGNFYNPFALVSLEQMFI